MIVGEFSQLIGAAGDVKELEYVSALHQTGDTIRLDASLRDNDIRMYLKSRHGIVVNNTQVRRDIIHGLASSTSQEDVLDLMEIVALLMIPTLLKAKQQMNGTKLRKVVQTPKGMLEYCLKMILFDTTGSSEPEEISPAFLKYVFLSYGEGEIAGNDELLEEMMQATGNAHVLDEHAFAQALTSDIMLYDLKCETRGTSSYEDAFTKRKPAAITKSDDPYLDDAEAGLSLDDLRDRKAVSNYVPREFLAPAIDVTAGLYRSRLLFVLLWATMVFTYLGYVAQFSIVKEEKQLVERHLDS
jgi:hypothetical protein